VPKEQLDGARKLLEEYHSHNIENN